MTRTLYRRLGTLRGSEKPYNLEIYLNSDFKVVDSYAVRLLLMALVFLLAYLMLLSQIWFE